MNTSEFSRYIGCCGAYCKTCKVYSRNLCKGCKLGFDTGEREINRAKCIIKLCCFRDKKMNTCADCPEIDTCQIIGSWFAKKGYKYKKYKEAINFIKENDYPTFIELANQWKNAYGKLK